MSAPSIPWFNLAPVLITLAAAVLAVLLEAFLPAKVRRQTQTALALLATAGATAWALKLALKANGSGIKAFAGGVLLDPAALFLQAAIGLCAFLGVLVIADRTRSGSDAFTAAPASAPGSANEAEANAAKLPHSEVFPLVLFATAGMILFPAAGDLLTMFVALEVLSLPLYLLTGLARHRRLLSQEASLKYFLLGAFASAFFLFGAAWVYGATGSVKLGTIASAVTTFNIGADPILYTGLILMVVGLAFKLGAVPFHVWTPDVYQGAPLPVTAFMSACTKLAAFGALLRLAYTVLAPLHWDMAPVLWTVAIATMIVGTVVAMTQANVVRMLAYSAIAHAGFILVGLVSISARGLSGSLIYLLGYGVASVGAFGVLSLLRLRYGTAGPGSGRLDGLNGLGRTHPVLATALTLFLLAFAGIPLTSGFVGKFAVFAAAFTADAATLAIIGIACSAAAAWFYARLIVAMFFAEPPDVRAEVERSIGLSSAAIAVSAVVTVGLGVWPGPVLDFAEKAAALLS